MSAAVAAILEGMPEPRDLRMHEADGRCVITAGSVVLFDYDAGDIAMRNMALAALRQLKFPGRVVAAVLGLSEAYVATLHNAARRDGSAALIGQPRPGRPGTVTAAQWQLARQWREQDVSDAEIGRRLGVAHTTISRAPGPARAGGRRRRRCSPGTGRSGNPRASRNLSPGRSRDRGLARVVPAGGGRRAGAGLAAGARGGVQVPLCGGDAAARVLRPRGCGGGAGRRGGRARPGGRAGGCGAAVGGEHVLRARRGDHGAVQAPGRRRGRAAGRAGDAARAAGAAAAAGADRRWQRPAGGAGHVRVRDAGRGPGDLRGVLRR